MTEAERAARRFQVFDTICQKTGFTPATLARAPADRLKELVSAEGYPVLMPSVLAGWAEEYATAKNHNGN